MIIVAGYIAQKVSVGCAGTGKCMVVIQSKEYALRKLTCHARDLLMMVFEGISAKT